MVHMLTCATIRTNWGFAGIVCSDRGLCGLVLPDPSEADVRRRMRRDWPEAVYDKSLAPSLQRQIRDYFAGKPVTFDYPLDLSGKTAFQRSVLAACGRIGYGHIATYGQLARTVGRPRAARAVGATMAGNPVPLVVPCHRVVGGSGALCGFSAPGGVPVKRRMLDLEAGGAKAKGRGSKAKRPETARNHA